MNKNPLYTAITVACCMGASSMPVGAVDVSIAELHFTGNLGAGFPLDCSAGTAATANCFATTGGLSDAAGDFGFFESVDPFYANPWSAVGVAKFNGFDGTSSEDLDTATDAALVTNGTVPTLFGALTQTITVNPDGNAATTDFTYAGTSGQGAFSYTFTLTDTQIAWGTIFNWSTNGGISVLAIFDCGVSGTDCVPVSTVMANGPFTNQGAVFSGTGSNFAPEPVDDNAGAQVGVLTAFSVLANDTDRDDPASPPITAPGIPTLSLPSATSAKGGTLAINGSTIEYTSVGLTAPDTDSFDYAITDASGLVSIVDATVNVTVSAFANTAPVAIADAINVDEDDSVDISIAGGVSSDVDNPAQSQTITFTSVGAPSNGSVVASAGDTVLTYTPNANYNGGDAFTFFVNDTIADSAASATITITVDPVNDQPACTDVSQGTGVDTALDIATSDLVDACSDIDVGDVLTYVTVGAPSQGGTIVDDGSGTTLTFTPASGFEGTETVTYTVSDGALTADADISIQVGGELLGNFTMLQSDGQRFGGTNDIVFTFAGSVDLDNIATLNDSEDDLDFNLDIATAGTTFFGSLWVAHDIRIFGPGTYSFDSGCTATEVQTTGCVAGSAAVTGPAMSMTVPAGMVGAHMLFDWNGNLDLAVVNVWERNAVWDQYGETSPVNQLWAQGGGFPPDESTTWELVSRDVNGDGYNGTPMVAGPFIGNYVNFNYKPSGAGEAVPDLVITAPTTSLGSSLTNPWAIVIGLISLLGFRRYVNKK